MNFDWQINYVGVGARPLKLAGSLTPFHYMFSTCLVFAADWRFICGS